MRKSEILTLILLVAAVPRLSFPQENGTQEDAVRLVDKCVEKTRQTNQVRSSYTYKFLDTTQDLDSSERVTKTHSTLEEVLYFGGKPYEHLLEKDGKKLSPAEQKKEDEKMDKAAREASSLTPEEQEARRKRIERHRQEENEWMRYVKEAYTFRFQPETILHNRPTYVIRATPKEDYRGKYAGMLRKTAATFFIDKQDNTLARMEAEVLDNISFGFFLGRLSQGTRVTFEQNLVNGEVWLPKHVTVHADARALVKKLRFDEDVAFSDYRKFQSDSRIVSTGESAAPPQ